MTVKEEIIKLLKETKRDGIDNLINYLEKSDFFKAPASTRFHLSEEGGLAQHSLNVYNCLATKYENPLWNKVFKKHNVSPDNIVIAALLHDLCKTYFYEIDYKNQKSYKQEDIEEARKNNTQIKKDKDGEFVWIQAPFYKVNDQLPLGHGEKSVILATKYINLTTNEMFAIRWHMGFSEAKEHWNMVGSSMEKCPLVLALHEADLEASHLLEVETDK